MIIELLTILVILGCLYTFLPERLQDVVRLALPALLAAAGAVLRAARRGIGAAARWIFDVPVSEVSDEAPDDERPLMSRSEAGTTPVPVPGTAESDDRALVVWLAGLKTPDNRDRFSANQIAAFVGGHRADVLQWIREARAGAPPAVVVSQVHDPERWHQNDPALRYEQPPITS